MVTDLRVAADQWSAPGRSLTLYVIVPEAHLIPAEDADPGWAWESERIVGLKQSDTEDRVDLNRVSALIIENSDGDATTLLHLWRMFGRLIRDTLLQPALDDEVVAFEVEVLSDVEMSYQRFTRTESLDLEVLSNSENQTSD